MLLTYLINIACFVLGVCLLQCLPALPSLGWSLALLVLAIIGCIYMPSKRAAILPCMLVIAGFTYAEMRAQWRMADRLEAELEGRSIEVEGYVASLPQATRYGCRFLFVPGRALKTGMALPGKIQVSWYGDPERVRAGERWHLQIKAKRPHGPMNPGSFDLESWFLQQAIGATATVQRGQKLEGMAVAAWLTRLRATLREQVNTALPDSPYAGVIVALTVGDQSGISPEQWQRFAKTGITHLVSISGLHVTMLAGLAAAITGWLWRRIPGLVSRFSALRAALVAGVVTALGYAALAGMAVPTQRTLFMLMTVAWCLWRARPAAISAVWAFCLAVVVLIDPFSVLSVGFWLSFLTVGVLLWVGGNRMAAGPKWQSWVLAQYAATLGSMPILLAVFGQLPLVSPLANAVAIPVVGMLVTPLALAGLLDPSGYLLQASAQVLAWVDVFLQWCAAWTWAQISFVPPPMWTILPAGVGVLLLLAPRGLPGRWLGPLLLLPLFVLRPAALPFGTYRATVLDVGQGLSVLVETRNSSLLFDTGVASNAERVILPALRAAGRFHLDRLVLSHNDTDHMGGAEILLAGLPIRHIQHGLPGDLPWLVPFARRQSCLAGQTWHVDGVDFRLLWPPEGFASKQDNANSCVLLIDNGKHRMLIPADLGGVEELRLIASGLPTAEILVAGHHGGKGSSSQALIDALKPQFAVFSVGYRNHFGHPRQDTLARFTAAGARNLRTDQSGALIFDVGETIALTQWRLRRKRYWHLTLHQEE